MYVPSSPTPKNDPVSSARRSRPLSVAMEKRAHGLARVPAGQDLLDQLAGQLGGHVADDLAVHAALLPQLRGVGGPQQPGEPGPRVEQGAGVAEAERGRVDLAEGGRERELGVDLAADGDHREVQARPHRQNPQRALEGRRPGDVALTSEQRRPGLRRTLALEDGVDAAGVVQRRPGAGQQIGCRPLPVVPAAADQRGTESRKSASSRIPVRCNAMATSPSGR